MDVRNTYLRSCAACHGMDGQGQSVGSMRVPSLKRDEAMNQTDQQLFDSISKGSGNMPSFKSSLREEQIRRLVHFIREEIQGRKASP